MFKKLLSLTVIICFFLTSLGPLPKAHADTVLGLPAPGTMVSLSSAYEPVMIKGLTVHKDNPFLFDFIVDVGQDKMSGEPLKKEGEKLIKYFLASLAIPDHDRWVNLSPYEKNRMIPESLGQTDMGRDLLEQDYILKQITASLIYPEKQLGKTFWDKVYSKAQQTYGTTQIPVNTFNKVWIMADKAEVFEHNQTAFVVKQHLKVMLEEDYLAMRKHADVGVTVTQASSPTHSIASQIVKQIVLPELEKEVNTGKNFANLRQIFNSVILSTWYKNNLKEALLNQVYADRSKVKGINLNDPTVKQQIYEQYLKAYKKGVFNYIKEDVNAVGDTMPRKYFSGGVVTAIADVEVIKDGMMGTQAMGPNYGQNGEVDFSVLANTGADGAKSNPAMDSGKLVKGEQLQEKINDTIAALGLLGYVDYELRGGNILGDLRIDKTFWQPIDMLKVKGDPLTVRWLDSIEAAQKIDQNRDMERGMPENYPTKNPVTEIRETALFQKFFQMLNNPIQPELTFSEIVGGYTHRTWPDGNYMILKYTIKPGHNFGITRKITDGQVWGRDGRNHYAKSWDTDITLDSRRIHSVSDWNVVKAIIRKAIEANGVNIYKHIYFANVSLIDEGLERVGLEMEKNFVALANSKMAPKKSNPSAAQWWGRMRQWSNNINGPDPVYDSHNSKETIFRFPDRTGWAVGEVERLVGEGWELVDRERVTQLSPLNERGDSIIINRREYHNLSELMNVVRKALRDKARNAAMTSIEDIISAATKPGFVHSEAIDLLWRGSGEDFARARDLFGALANDIRNSRALLFERTVSRSPLFKNVDLKSPMVKDSLFDLERKFSNDPMNDLVWAVFGQAWQATEKGDPEKRRALSISYEGPKIVFHEGPSVGTYVMDVSGIEKVSLKPDAAMLILVSDAGPSLDTVVHKAVHQTVGLFIYSMKLTLNSPSGDGYPHLNNYLSALWTLAVSLNGNDPVRTTNIFKEFLIRMNFQQLSEELGFKQRNLGPSGRSYEIINNVKEVALKATMLMGLNSSLSVDEVFKRIHKDQDGMFVIDSSTELNAVMPETSPYHKEDFPAEMRQELAGKLKASGLSSETGMEVFDYLRSLKSADREFDSFIGRDIRDGWEPTFLLAMATMHRMAPHVVGAIDAAMMGKANETNKPEWLAEDMLKEQKKGGKISEASKAGFLEFLKQAEEGKEINVWNGWLNGFWKSKEAVTADQIQKILAQLPVRAGQYFVGVLATKPKIVEIASAKDLLTVVFDMVEIFSSGRGMSLETGGYKTGLNSRYYHELHGGKDHFYVETHPQGMEREARTMLTGKAGVALTPEWLAEDMLKEQKKGGKISEASKAGFLEFLKQAKEGEEINVWYGWLNGFWESKEAVTADQIQKILAQLPVRAGQYFVGVLATKPKIVEIASAKDLLIVVFDMVGILSSGRGMSLETGGYKTGLNSRYYHELDGGKDHFYVETHPQGMEREARTMLTGKDKAAVANVSQEPTAFPGGIDLNTSNGMQWKVSRDGRGVEMNIDPATIERVRREGINSLSPVILRMTPVASIWPLLGLQAPVQ